MPAGSSPSRSDAVKGRTILITGASSGIGEAAALELGQAGAPLLLVARTREKLEAVADQIEEAGGTAYVHPCDLSEARRHRPDGRRGARDHGQVDILVNNAGKSIRRSVNRSYDRFHDYQRTMQLNYFAPVKLILELLPIMREHGTGHIVNISTIGLQINTPAVRRLPGLQGGARRVLALDRARDHRRRRPHHDGVYAAGAHADDRPDQDLRPLPTLTPEEAADMITEAIRKRPKRIASTLGNLGQLTYAIAPGAQDLVANRAYQLFPEGDQQADRRNEAEQRAFAQATRGVHW